MSEVVNHPAHYNAGKIEVIEAIEDWALNFSLGNAIKYIARADHKGKPLEDLKKARWYIDREIARREKCDDDPDDPDEADAVLVRHDGEHAVLKRIGGKYSLDATRFTICDVCEMTHLEGDQYPCNSCIHGFGDDVEHFKLDPKKEVTE